MSDRIFYVAAQAQGKDRTEITGYVPAKFLTLDGKPVVDPTRGGSQNAFIYADDSDKHKTRGDIANPNNYLIVPANYTERQARAYAAEIADTIRQAYPGDEAGAAGLNLALGRMTGAFFRDGSQDLQRHAQWGIPKGSFVPAFIGAASYHLGSVTRWAGLPIEWSEIGGGIPNRINALSIGIWNDTFAKLGFKPKKPIDSDGPYGLSWHNHDNIVKGFADADAPRKGPSPIDNFGYGSHPKYPAGQIGDGNGLGVGDWRFALAGVDPMNPTRPVPPPHTNGKPVLGSDRVNGNTSLASSAVPVARPDSQDSFSDRFSKWGFSPIPDPPASFDQRFGNWGSVPAGSLGDIRSPVLRELEKHRRSTTPDGQAPTSVQGMPTQAFQPDAVYSPAGDFFGNFSRDEADARPPMRGIPAADFSSEETNHIDPSENAAGGPRPARYQLRRVSSAFPDITLRDLNQPAPRPLDDGQEPADMRALEAKFLSSGNINDAVTLYNARKLIRRGGADWSDI